MKLEEAKELIKSQFAAQLNDNMSLSELGISKLSVKSGVSIGTISNYLSKGCLPSAAVALALASELGVTVGMLLTGKDC